MRKIWWIAVILEAILVVVLGWQIATSPSSLTFLVIGILMIYSANRKRSRHPNRTSSTNLQFILGIIFIVVPIIINSAFWLMLLILIFLVIYMTNSKSSQSNILNHISNRFPWQKKEYIDVHVENETSVTPKIQKHKWWGNEVIGHEIFSWQDINLDLLAGDTIVDLGNTILPKNTGVVIIRKGIGKTRILVPIGTGVKIDHTALHGSLVFENHAYQLFNDRLQIKSENYEESSRHLKIMTNVIWGELEVIYV